MTSPQLDGGPTEVAPSRHQLRLLWETGTGAAAGLPDNYFLSFGYSAAPDILEEVAATGTRELTLTTYGLPNALAADRRLFVSLRFPDRRDYTPCRHPGGPDAYVVEMTIVFDGGTGILSTGFEQFVSTGAY